MSASSNPKREQILLTGKELFWKFGFKRVTIEEICKEAGVSKMTFYKHFENKLALVKTIMDVILDSALEDYRQIINSDIPYPEKVVQMVELKRKEIKTMSNEFFREYVQSDDPDLINYLNKLSGETMKMFVDDFAKAQREGNIRKDLKVEFIMLMMTRMIEMTHDEPLLEMYDNPEHLVLEITNFLFYGILNRDEH